MASVAPNGTSTRKATVRRSTYLGSTARLHAELADGGTILVEMPARHAQVQTGDSVHVWWSKDDEIAGLRE